MPSRKRVSFRKSRSRKSMSLAKLSKKVRRMSRRVNKHPPNVKWITVPTQGFTTTLSTANPLNVCLNTIDPITSAASLQPNADRCGDICKMGYIDLKLDIYTTITTIDDQVVRVCLVRSEFTDGVIPNIADIFNSATPQPYDCRNVLHKNFRKFHLIYDRTFLFGPPQISVSAVSILNTASPSERIIHIKKRLGFNTNYSLNDNGDVTDIDTNGLFLMIFTDASVSTQFVVNGAYNISFYDA